MAGMVVTIPNFGILLIAAVPHLESILTLINVGATFVEEERVHCK